VTERLIRIATTLAMLMVVDVATVISYQAYELVTTNGETRASWFPIISATRPGASPSPPHTTAPCRGARSKSFGPNLACRACSMIGVNTDLQLQCYSVPRRGPNSDAECAPPSSSCHWQ
jgi:hypothetical protein